jgi:hypothetical protein
MRHDKDIAGMSPAELRRALQRLRRTIRRHRGAEDNARCWHNDLALYGALPEGRRPGKMTSPEKTLLRNCKRYIRRQQCWSHGCPRGKKK